MLKTRTIAIGDIHGCLDELKELLNKCKYNKETDRVIILGDLCDRGPYSIESIRFVNQMGFDCVKGNHDLKHEKYYNHFQKKKENPKYKIPVKPFYGDKLKIQEQLTKEDINYIQSLPFYIDLNYNWLAVHAGVEPNIPIEEQNDERLCHIRYIDKDTLRQKSLTGKYEQPENSIFWDEVYNGNYNIIYGHNVNSLYEPKIFKTNNNKWIIGIDLGCCFGGKLCAMILEKNNDFSFEFVQAKKEYWPKTW